MFDIQAIQPFGYSQPHFVFGYMPESKPDGDIRKNGQVKQQWFLHHQSNPATIIPITVGVYKFPIEMDFTLLGPEQACQNQQQGAFPGPIRTYQRDHFILLNHQVIDVEYESLLSINSQVLNFQ